MIPYRFVPIVFGFVLSSLMSLVVSGIATVRAFGPVDGFAGLWLHAWLPSWAVALPLVLLIAPLARRAVQA